MAAAVGAGRARQPFHRRRAVHATFCDASTAPDGPRGTGARRDSGAAPRRRRRTAASPPRLRSPACRAARRWRCWDPGRWTWGRRAPAGGVCAGGVGGKGGDRSLSRASLHTQAPLSRTPAHPWSGPRKYCAEGWRGGEVGRAGRPRARAGRPRAPAWPPPRRRRAAEAQTRHHHHFLSQTRSLEKCQARRVGPRAPARRRRWALLVDRRHPSVGLPRRRARLGRGGGGGEGVDEFGHHDEVAAEDEDRAWGGGAAGSRRVFSGSRARLLSPRAG